MSYVLDQSIGSTSQYVELKCPGTEKLIVQISNGGVFIAFGVGVPTPVYGPDEPYLPVVATLGRRCDAIRLKARAPISNPAPQVQITAVPG